MTGSARSPEVGAFLATLPADTRDALEALRRMIAAAAPDAVEAIACGRACVRYKGRPLVSFGAGKGHCAFYVQGPAVMEANRDLLRGYDTAKGAVRFSASEPLPDELVTRLVQDRMAETDRPKG
jgi:uncharacterized protein YdhG (YjbR/CyaY superfamily)